MGLHVYIDNSNLFGGALRCAASMESEVPRYAVRIDFRNFITLVERSRHRSVGVWAGSVPPGNEELWSHARALGYNVDLLRRIQEDDGKLLEQGVDEMIHAKISDSILDYKAPQTLVLVTGDGSASPSGTSFLRKAEQAIRHGWNVEVYSWFEQLSRKFLVLSARNVDRMSVYSLDKWYNYIVFIKPGGYEVTDTYGRSTISHIQGRSVHTPPRHVVAVPCVPDEQDRLHQM